MAGAVGVTLAWVLVWLVGYVVGFLWFGYVGNGIQRTFGVEIRLYYRYDGRIAMAFGIVFIDGRKLGWNYE